LPDLAAFGAALRAELAPVGAFQFDLAARIVSTSWRARRARPFGGGAPLGRYLAEVWRSDRGDPQVALGFGLTRDGNGPRALDTVARYLGAVLAELFRSPTAFGARQAQAKRVPAASPALLESTCAKTKRIPERGQNNGLAREQRAFP
jgi:hypothetical protein